MTYLLLTLHPTHLNVTNLTAEQTPLSEQSFAFSDFELPKSIQPLAETITATFTDINGAVLSKIPSEFYTENSKVTELNGSHAEFSKLLSEALNIPVIDENWSKNTTDLETAFQQQEQYTTWNLDYYGYHPGKEEYSVESLLTIGNGFMGLRGTLPEMMISKENYPATYIAGLYNKEESTVAGQIVENEDFVNTPNSQYISIKVADSADWLRVEEAKVHHLHRRLELKTGLFSSEMIIEDNQKHLIKLTTLKLVNMAKMNNYSIKYMIEPLNFSKKIALKTASDGSVYNFNVERYRNLTAKHFHVTALKAQENEATIEMMTNQSKIAVRQKAQIAGDFFAPDQIQTNIGSEKIEQVIEFEATEGHVYTFEKHVQVTASIATESWNTPAPIPTSFESELAESKRAWQKLWEKADIAVSGDMMSQKLLRTHIYHLLVSASPYSNPELDVSITARGLHGEAYRGHIFWDEIFILPFYIMHFPETAKQILMYRYNRLGKAKENALESNYTGAMYPWQSGLDGGEETQKLHLNPLNGEWGEDHSILQRHVSLAIAYNVWMYWNNTDDTHFIKEYGAEMLLEIANFWRSATTYDETTGRYFIDKVMGPDEFHEAYPNSEVGGLKNNAYTNLMVVWLFEEIQQVLSLLSTQEKEQLMKKTGITEENLAEMDQISHLLSIEVNDEGIIAQYEGYFDLKEIDWDAAREKYGNIYRMDRILKADGKSPDDYKVSKQADTLMLFYNLNKERIDRILAELGYDLPSNYLEKNLLYYLNRTSHGSTLSRIVHAQLAEQVAFHDLSWTLYQEALHSDYQDIQGGTTAEGIHTGVMASTIYVTLTTYAGIDLKTDVLSVTPNLPEHWTDLAFTTEHRGVHFTINMSKTTVDVTASKATRITVSGTTYTLEKGKTTTINY
ncbi:glycoside hydrolase family 65 protein [Enterococcus sp. LJL99]